MTKVKEFSNLEIGKKIKTLRKNRGLTQEQLAFEAGISLRYLQKIENNESNAKVDSLRKVANVLEVPPCYLQGSFYHDSLAQLDFICEKELLDNVPIAIYVCDLEGKVLYRNSAFENIFGSKTEREYVYLWDSCASPEEETILRKKIADVLSTQKTFIEPLKTKKRTVDGNIIETYLIWNYVRTSNQVLKGVIGAVVPL